MSAWGALLFTLLLVSSFSLVGAVVAYLALPRVRANEKAWELFAGYLMVLLSLDLVAAQLIKRTISEVGLTYLVQGFAVGALVAWASMNAVTALRQTKGHMAGHSAKGLGVLIFLILAIHEISEGLSVAEIFFEISTRISVTASLMPVAILALHEFPEGLLLVTPFFLEGRVRTGLLASLVNQGLFLLSGAIGYRVLLTLVEPSIAQEAFISTLPAGGIAYMGLHELRMAFLHKKDGVVLFFTNYKLAALSLAALVGVAGSLYLVNHAVQESLKPVISGYEYNPFTGTEVPIIYGNPCEHEVDLGHCLVH